MNYVLGVFVAAVGVSAKVDDPIVGIDVSLFPASWLPQAYFPPPTRLPSSVTPHYPKAGNHVQLCRGLQRQSG